ncbi:hypothetical protein LUZ60_012166 [Juncus effusus]|nr:hypothetical protein LUZ60_012166 [Juncus effusus]
MPDRVSQMAENRNPDQNDETTPDWEFVSLTASAYSAAPGPQNPHAPASEKTKLDSSSYGKRFEDFESPSSLFMSRHFLLHKEKELDASSKYELDGSSDGKMKGIDDELQKSLSHVVKMEERESVGMKGVDDELQKSLSHVVKMEERESAGMKGVDDELQKSLSSSLSGFEERESDGNEEEEEEERESEERERESWWRKQIVSLYKRARERKSGFSMWKVLVTATLVGVAIVGQRWRREKLQFKQIKLHFLVNNERISCMVGPFDQYKRISNQNYASMLDYASLA